MTKQRRIILDVIQQSKEHLTAEQVFLSAKEELPTLAMATVYRNLKLLVAAGEIRRVSFLNAPDRFDRNTSAHDHCICEKCGKLSDVTLENLQDALEWRIDGKITSYELNIHYVCQSCLAGQDG